MMTRRERLERRREQRQAWAQARQDDAAARLDQAHRIADMIPLGQPILVGHHSERRHRRDLDRIDSNMARGCDSLHMAEHHVGKAAGLQCQLDSSIFSDDPDAVDALRRRIAGLEAKRDRIKAYNASCRRGARDLSLLDSAEREHIVSLARVAPYAIRGNGAFPSYVLSNLGADIRRNQERVADLERRARRTERAATAGGLVIEGGEWVRVTFAEKPARPILDALKAAGFRWGAGSWHGPRASLPIAVVAATQDEQR